jgi:hypothetical protein
MPKKSNTAVKAGTAIAVVVILLISGLYVYLEYYHKEAEVVEVAEIEIDERVSPLTDQAVFFEINRIRRKGIIDHMENSGSRIINNILQRIKSRSKDIYLMLDGYRPGIGWRKKPIFNFIAILDGFEYIAPKDFNTWDTDYMNMEFFRNVEEEQHKVEIEIKILDKKKKILKRDPVVMAMDSFQLTYDFKTGRWNGDDYFNDSDGYGHFNGSLFEMWFDIRQTDYDADGIPFWTEVNVLKSNPRVNDIKNDPDNDGIPTAWEWKWGYNPHKWDNHTYLDPDDDGIQNIEEWYMEKWLANPYFPEIYIEADDMERKPFRPYKIAKGPGRIIKRIQRLRIMKTGLDGSKNTFWEESQQMLIEIFNKHSITVHIDDGCMGGGGENLPFIGEGYNAQYMGYFAEFYKNNFADDRKGIFRYLVSAYGGGHAHPQDFKHYYDFMSVPSFKVFFKNNLGNAMTPRTMRIGRAVQVMHELGHTCGYIPTLTTEGVDNSSGKWGNPPDYPWYDYYSCMNYNYFSERLLDYSDGTNGENDFDDWSNIDIGFFQRPSEFLEGLEGPPGY